jgi:hypothetical protein
MRVRVHYLLYTVYVYVTVCDAPCAPLLALARCSLLPSWLLLAGAPSAGRARRLGRSEGPPEPSLASASPALRTPAARRLGGDWFLSHVHTCDVTMYYMYAAGPLRPPARTNTNFWGVSEVVCNT